jgi:hypothetical protein
MTSDALRRAVYAMLIAVSAGGMLGRLLAVNSVDRIRLEQHLKAEFDKGKRPDWQQQRPFLSANDRSRWCTVRALVEHGTYAIDDVTNEPNWDTIDMVKHDGRLYSSKPPLLATLLAGPYWLIHRATGWTLGTHPYEIGRFLLVLVNVVPLVIGFFVLGRLVDRFGLTDWGRIFVMAVATQGTFLSTFAVTLNNHLFAALSVLFAVAAAVPIWLDGERRFRYFAAAGFFAAFAAACELPALSFLGLLGLALLWKAPGRTLLAGLPAALVVAAAFFGTNWLAVGGWKVPYAHRQDGARLAEAPAEAAAELDAGTVPDTLRAGLASAGIELRPEATVSTVEAGQRWIVTDDESDDRRRFAIVLSDHELAGNVLEIRAWDNWYDYTFMRGGKERASYWRSNSSRGPIDRGEPSRAWYAFHVFVGHHGIFSLTPVWLLAFVGMAMAIGNRTCTLRGLAALVAVCTLVCLAFYLAAGTENRNYGGSTSGLRWMFWFAPLWSLMMLPAVDACSSHRGWRGLCLVLLALSVLSVSFPTWNPWTHPWLVNLTNYMGWTEL